MDSVTLAGLAIIVAIQAACATPAIAAGNKKTKEERESDSNETFFAS